MPRFLKYLFGFTFLGVIAAVALGAMFGSGVASQAQLEFTVYAIVGAISGAVIGSLIFFITNPTGATAICSVCGGVTRKGRCENSLCSGYGESSSIKVKVAKNARHWVATVWLSLMLVANSLVVLVVGLSLFAKAGSNDQFQLGLVALCAIANVVCCVALFQWKRWGFYGFVVSAVVAFFLNVSSGFGIARSAMGLLGVVVLYLVLQAGGPLRAWPRLT